MDRVKKYCQHCLKKCEVEYLGILAIGLVDGSTMHIFRCKECGRQFSIIEKHIIK